MVLQSSNAHVSQKSKFPEENDAIVQVLQDLF